MASSLHTKFAHLQIPLGEVLTATNNFHQDNIIGHGEYGPAYKGQLQRFGKLMKIATRRLDRVAFGTEVSMLYELKHTNLVSIIGFCDENVIITTYASKGSLEKHLNSPNLTWTQRLRISVGVARALSYLHYDEGRGYGVIHRNINTSTVLLDENFVAKLTGFEISIKKPVNQMDQVFFSEPLGTIGYLDPESEKTKGVTYKSDIYSFGVILFELLCGREAYIENEADRFLAQLVKHHYENGTLQDIIHPGIRNHMSPESVRIYSEIAYSCLNEERAHRPDMTNVVKELEKALGFQLRRENLGNNLEHLKIPLNDITLATDNFSDAYRIVVGHYYTLYRGELDCFDKETPLSVEGKNKGQPSKKHNTVFIKHIRPRDDEHGEEVFYTEIEKLSSVKHHNIVSLLGFCIEGSEMVLVTEKVFDKYLGNCIGNVNDKRILTWEKRLKICIDVAHSLKYLHYGIEDQKMVITRFFSIYSIGLDDNWRAKIFSLGLSVFMPSNQEGEVMYLKMPADTPCRSKYYIDPEYVKSGMLKRESDVYSFGVILFEILCGRLADDPIYIKESDKGLAPVARRSFSTGTLEDMVDPIIMEEISEHTCLLHRGPNKDSLQTFIEIARQCISETQDKRPTMKVVVKELEKSLLFQLDPLEIRLEKTASATNNFADENLIKKGKFANDYKGQIPRSGQVIDICARRLKPEYGQGDTEFRTEISILSSLKHTNIISLIGFCDEYGEKILIYEHAVHGSLDQHLGDPNLTWFQRLKICLGVARGLSHIHYDVIHCDINSSKIFLDKDWEPKISGFELSTKYPQSWRHRLLSSHSFDNTNMTPKYDVYCFGLLLFEVLYGVKPMKTQRRQDIINHKLLEQMDSQSLTFFKKIVDSCLNEHPVQRPTMDQVVKELEDVFELQWKHDNLEHSAAANKDEGTSSDLLKLERLKITLNEIKAATNGFDEAHFVASGAFGSVYKGELDVLDVQNSSSTDGERPKIRTKTSVAIKCLKNRQDEASKQGFLTEIELLTSCKHQNVISLLGLYIKADDIILVYEYASKGSLSDYLGSTRKNINLTWGKRLEICLDVARGISYLHTNMENKPRIIHRDIKSENILLDENLNAKIADFGLSKFHFRSQQASTIHTKHIVGTHFYLDPEYLTSAKYKKESDVYSFGVVLFEMLSGRLAYEPICIEENDKGLAPIARRRFNEKTLKELIDPKMIDEDGEHVVTLNRGPNQESFEAFSRIAYQCLAETQAKRPTMEAVIKELENALNLQGETVVLSRFRLGDILLATKNFSETCCIGLHAYGKMYKAELDDFDDKSLLAFKEKSDGEWPKTWPKTRIYVAIKRISGSMDVKQRFFSEIERRTSCKHPNIVDVLGFCDEGDEVILVYEHASNKSLEYYLKSVDNADNLTWTQRLQMCLGIARGLNHLHTKMDSQEGIIHGDITSANIMLGKNLEPKIAYFGILEFHLANQEANTLASTQVYRDPEFEKTRVMKKESDIYSFGVILFEIFCGRLAYDPIYTNNNQKGLPHVAHNHFNDGTIKILLDPKLKEVTDDDIFTSSRGPNKDSLDRFLKIAYQCLEEAQAKRPPMEVVIKELEMALNFQENLMKSLQIALEDIKLATENFSPKNCCGSGRYSKAYIGKLPYATIVAKRWDSKFDDQFRTLLDILSKRKHKNIVGLVAFCNDTNEKIIVYEYMSKGSLNKYLKDPNLRWIKRLKICIDVANALEFLHGGDVTLKKVVHRNIRSHGILLNDNWDAKISNFELSSLDSSHQDMEHISNDVYLDPEYKQGFLTEKSDIYSFGVILFEILCGRLAWVEGHEDNSQSLVPLVKHYYEHGKLAEMVFKDVKEQSVSQSLIAFADIAYQCLHEDGNKRPRASDVAIQLKKALDFQEDSEIWEPKLPKDYKEIMESSKAPEIYRKRDIYEKLSNGILLSKEKVWFILSDNGEAYKMVSATTAKFSYKNHESHKWRSIHISRFQKVAKMMDISNLKIQVTIDNQFLTPNVTYGIFLVFKFYDPRVVSRKQCMYTNLKYKNGTETLHSYFATWRDEEWMMIELHRFLNHNEDASFTFLLESISRYYCTSGAIYIEGIEFRAIKKMAQVDNMNQKVQQIQKSNSDSEQPLTVNDKLFLMTLNGNKHLLLSATGVLYNSEKWEFFRFKSSADSRFQNVVELLPRQVFRIKYKIETQLLSPFTEYQCYLVFKLSERCRGLHCPVKVRDLLCRDLLCQANKECKNIYFRTPAPWNQHDAFWIPAQRKDGWMEVVIWKFNSKNYTNNLGNDVIPVNLKLVTYEGTMSGLIICGLEFRPA